MLDDTLIRAGAQEHPLVASRRDVRAFAGQTVAQIVQSADLDPARGLPQVTLWRDGRSWTVPMDQWGRVRPRAGATVDIHYDTQGAAIAAVATSALSAAAPGIVSTFLGTGLAATLATSALVVVGGLLINSLIAPPEPGGGNDDPNYAITGTGNVAAKYRPVPLVCGRHRMFPVKSAAGYSETVNGDIYWRGRYCFGWGKVGLEDLRIGNTPITEFDNVEIEFLNVDKDYTLAHTPGLDALTQLKLSEDQAPGAILREVTETYVFAPQSVAGRVTLRVAPNDKLPGYGYNFRVDTREAGGSWVAGTTYSGQTAPVIWTSPAYADGVDRIFRVILTAIQEPPEGQEVAPILALVHRPSISVTRATAEYQPGHAIKSWRYGAERMSLYPGDVSEEQFNVLLEEATPVVRLTTNDAASAAIDISYPQGLYDSDDGETQSHEANFAFRYQRVGDTAWTDAGTERHEADAQTLIRFTKTIAFPTPGEYRVEVTRTDPIDTDSGDQNRGYLTAIRSFANTRLPSHNRVAEIAVRIKATDQLNGQIDSLNAIVQQFAPKWTGTGWGPQEPVRHPAWVFAELLRGPHLRRPVEDTKIDRNALKAWADEEPHWTFDYVFDTDSRVADALKLVAAAGRAKPHLADLRYSVIRDGADGPIRQVFTPRNSWGFKGLLAFSREIHGFRVQFRSERLEWEQDEITVYLDGYDETNATEFEALELPGVVITENETDRGNPYRLARYHLANVILRPETYEWRADFEHLAVTRGDKVQLVHDVPQIGVGAARITEVQKTPEGALTGLVLDDVFPGAGGIDFRLTVRRADGTRISFSADNGDTLDPLWEPTQAVSAAGIAAGDLVAIEKTTQETMEVLITGIFQEDDLAARLVGVPAAPAVLTADSEAIPEYDPIITRLPERYGPPQPVPTRVFSDAASATKARDGVLRVRIGVELQQYEGPPGVWLRLRWSDPLRGGWIEGARVLPAATLFTSEVPEGLPVAVEVRAEDRDGNHRGWVRAGEVNGSPGALPAAPEGLAGIPGVRDIKVDLGARPRDVRGWNVYESLTESGGYNFLVFIDSMHAAFEPSANCSWFRLAAVDYSGREGPLSAPFQIRPTGVGELDFSDDLKDRFGVGPLPAPTLSVVSETAEGPYATVTASVSSVAGADSYEFDLSLDGGVAWRTYPAGQSKEWGIVRGTALRVRARAVGVGRRSGYSDIVDHVAAVDAVPPAAPMWAGTPVRPGFGNIWLDWEDNTEDDLHHYEIYEHTAETPGPDAATEGQFSTTASTFLRSGLGAEETRYYWVRALDTSGNASDWSTVQSGTTPVAEAISDEELATALNNTLDAQNLEAIKIVTSLPTQLDTQYVSYQGKLYRWNEQANGYVKDVPIEDLVGEIGTELLAPKAVTASRLALIDTSKIYTCYFDSVNVLEDWEIIKQDSGAQATVVPSTSSALGTGVFIGGHEADTGNNGGVTLISKIRIPFDPNKMYRMRVRLRQYYGNTARTYVGWRGYDRDGNEVQVRGNEGGYFYHAAANESLPYRDWTEFVGYTRGHASVDGDSSAYPSASSPGKMHPDVHYIAPYLLLNYNNQPGRCDVDFIEVDVMTGGTLIEPDSIDTPQLRADSVKTAQIEAGAVRSEQLASDAVLTRHLVVSDFHNLANHQVWQTGDREDIFTHGADTPAEVFARNPSSGSNFIKSLPTPYGFHVLQFSQTSDGNFRMNVDIPINEGEEVVVTGMMASSGNNPSRVFEIRLYLNTPDGAYLTTLTQGESHYYTGYAKFEKKFAMPADVGSIYGIMIRGLGSAGQGDLAITDIRVYRRNGGELIVDGSIEGRHLTVDDAVITNSAQVADATITSAHIESLTADKITAGDGLNAGIRVGSGGVSLGTVDSRASNPAARINATPGTTVDPGRVRIFGAETLDDWRDGTDINGGKIKTGSVDALSLKADTISTRELRIGNYENLGGGTNYEAFWDGIGAIYGTSQASVGVYMRHYSGGTDLTLKDRPKVLPGQRYRIEYWVYLSNDFVGDGNTKFRVGDHNNGNDLIYALAHHDVPKGSWTKIAGEFVIPGGCYELRVSFGKSFTSGSVSIGAVMLKCMTEGSLVVNGGITTSKINGRAVTDSVRHIIASDRNFGNNSWAVLNGAGYLCEVVNDDSVLKIDLTVSLKRTGQGKVSNWGLRIRALQNGVQQDVRSVGGGEWQPVVHFNAQFELPAGFYFISIDGTRGSDPDSGIASENLHFTFTELKR
ncbi:tail fiber protein [Roseivivax marinus]|uniref:Tail fiber protein n=1 Tax=Roseivivax marinus TaxID=1379903 RepID=W4HGC8_9RHOB|nr:host specificity factor TipJ family phage tail protein [Roseivivax marinus]ETW11201.1 tail fiber protein [Roseivivax marinus]